MVSCRAGDAQAFAALVHRFERQIARTIYGILGDCPEGEDIGQEVFIRFFNSLHRFRGECSLATYLTRIAINLSLNELKRRRRKQGLFSESMEEARRIAEAEPNRVEWNELQRCIGIALQKLPDKYRLVVVLRLMEGRSIRETADILKTAEGTVMSRLARAQELLRTELQPLLGEYHE
ncbi:sigma-70 family RNA polymerase sigma factor [bacterium]|nr:sigma-70 family RNA polymerase sigma factor [bacterium]